MNAALSATLVILSMNVNILVSGKSAGNNDGSNGGSSMIPPTNTNNQWTKSGMEMWESFGRWRRERGFDDKNYNYPEDPRRDIIDIDRERLGDGRDHRGRWNGNVRRDRSDRSENRDDHRRGRSDRRSGRRPDRSDPVDYPKPTPVVVPKNPEIEIPTISFLPPLPIIIEPIRTVPVMPSIIEPYPVPVIDSTSYYEASSSLYYPTISSSDVYYSTISSLYNPTISSLYYPTISSSYHSDKKYISYNNSSSSTTFGSTVIITTPESTVTTSVSGRYRAMSNSASGTTTTSNWAGLISFALVLITSIIIMAIV